LLSPVVRRLVTEHGIDVNALVGSGPGARITREDVLDHIDRNGLKSTLVAAAPATVVTAPAPSPATVVTAPAPAPAQAPAPASRPAVVSSDREQVIALSKIRKLTGSHMIMSKSTSPHAFSVVEVDYANVDRARTAIKDSWKAGEGFSLTYLPFISRAVVDALREFPHLNASIDGDNLIVHGYVDLGIAVDLDYTGLLVPVVRNADGKRIRAIAREINDLASRAHNRKLSPDEIQGGTFTISNNGSAGSVLTMPIINQPQVAILSTDAIVRKPVVVTAADGSESIAIHPVGNLAMSWDHRAFDGAYSGRFLARVKQILESQDWSAEL
jgi:2-oxoglutarate dehydrogenase E2 component (dihydrolipoamide succinyltransferase)